MRNSVGCFADRAKPRFDLLAFRLGLLAGAAQQFGPDAGDDGGLIRQRLVRQRRQEGGGEVAIAALAGQRLAQSKRGLVRLGVGDNDQNVFPAHAAPLLDHTYTLGATHAPQIPASLRGRA